MVQLNVNGTSHDLPDVDPGTPLLWVLRDRLGLVGQKFGCGVAACGACTVHMDGQPVRSCSVPVDQIGNAKIRTIEGLAGPDGKPHPLQAAWIAADVPQCGYCQAGQLMSAAALLAKNNRPSDAAIDEAMNGNVCRCGTYNRIRAAIKTAAAQMQHRT